MNPIDTSSELARDPRNYWATCFRYAMWLGIIQDFLLGVPAIFWPNELLSLLGQATSRTPANVSLAAVVLITLGAMYIPAAINPYRYPWVAILAVAARPPGILFFFCLYPDRYPIFGVVDTFLALIQIPTLWLAFHASPKPRHGLMSSRVNDTKAQPPGEYRGTSFQELRNAIWSDPYSKLPYYISWGPLKPIRFFNHSSRNLSDQRDLLPYFDKLIHANGICLSGVWEITEASPYSGYFARGAKGLVIVRASVAGLTTSANTRRAFGIAGKIFPTLDPQQTVYPANFVTVSHLSGVRSASVLDIDVTNSPTVGLDPLANFVNRVVFRLMDTRPGFRQLHPISTLGLAAGDLVRTPDLMMLKVDQDFPRVAQKDFREELHVRHYPGGQIVFRILVRDQADQAWSTLGTLTLTEDVVSETGDKRLHFWIPRDRPNE